MSIDENLPINETSDDIFSFEKYQAYGNRLHYNTAIDFIVNAIATYIVLKHSTKAMGIYKYYILSTIISSFLLDFHLTFIFGPLSMMPTTIMCGSGFVARNFDYFWGQVIPYAFLHIAISYVGWSIVIGLLFQYFQLKGQTQFFHSYYGITLMLIFTTCYTFPSIFFVYFQIDYAESYAYAKKTYPDYYKLFDYAPCYTVIMDKGGRAHFLSQLIQVCIVAVVGSVVGFKINKVLREMGHLLSPTTLKARKQFFYALGFQITIPMLFIVIPMAIILISVLNDMKHLSNFSYYIFHILAFHSAANAVTVIIAITPYRKAVIRWRNKLPWFKSANTIVDPIFVSANLSSYRP